MLNVVSTKKTEKAPLSPSTYEKSDIGIPLYSTVHNSIVFHTLLRIFAHVSLLGFKLSFLVKNFSVSIVKNESSSKKYCLVC